MKTKSCAIKMLLAVTLIVISACIFLIPKSANAAGTINRVDKNTYSITVHADYQDANTCPAFKKKWTVFGPNANAKHIYIDSNSIADGQIICLFDIPDGIKAYEAYSNAKFYTAVGETLKYVNFGVYEYLGKEYFCAYSNHSVEAKCEVIDNKHAAVTNPRSTAPVMYVEQTGSPIRTNDGMPVITLRNNNGGAYITTSTDRSDIVSDVKTVNVISSKSTGVSAVTVVRTGKSSTILPVKVTFEYDNRISGNGTPVSVSY